MKLETIQLHTKKHLKEHWVAYIMAFIVGCFMIFPQILFRIEAGDRFRGFNIFETDAEYSYMSLIREAMDGEYKLSNPLTKGGKDFPYAQPPLLEIIVAMTAKFFRIGMEQVLILFRFFAPAGLYMLMYFFLYSITDKEKRVATLAPFVIILGINLVSYPRQLLEMIQGTYLDSKFLIFSRPINPQLSTIFFFAFLFSFWKMIHSLKWEHFMIYCLMLFGVTFYVYPYTWSFELVFMSVFACIFAIKKRFTNIIPIIIIIFGGFIISIPYFVNTYFLIHHPSYQGLTLGWGLYESRKLVFSGILFITFLFLLGIYYFDRVKRKDFFWFFIPAVITGFIVINQQIITGQVLYYGHYHWYFHRPIFIITGVSLLFLLINKFHIHRILNQIIYVAIFFVVMFNAYNIQMASYRYHFSNYINYQKYGDVIQWLNDNTNEGEVVFVPGSFYYPEGIPFKETDTKPSRMLTRFVFTYTPLNVYYFSDQALFLMPYPNYSLYNLHIVLKATGVVPEKANAYLRNNPKIFRDIYLAYFKVLGRPYGILTAEDVTDKRIEDALIGYNSFYVKPWEEILSKYPLDYIVWDKEDMPDWPWEKVLNTEGIFQEIYNKDGIVVYKFLG